MVAVSADPKGRTKRVDLPRPASLNADKPLWSLIIFAPESSYTSAFVNCPAIHTPPQSSKEAGHG